MGGEKDVGPFVGMFQWRKYRNEIYATLMKEKAYRRLFKDVLATGITIIIALLPNMKKIYGGTAYIGAMTCVFVLGHPGRKIGGMLEAIGIALVGTTVGVAWMTIAVFLGSLIQHDNPQGALCIRAAFLSVAMFVHGYVRSNTPRLFIAVLLMAIPNLLGLTRPDLRFTRENITMFLYPMLTGIASLLLVNVCIFPEFGTTNLAQRTIETLQMTVKILSDSTEFFVESCGHDLIGVPPASQRDGHEAKIIRLVDLTSSKPLLRAKITECKGVYRDSAYDISYACLAPKELKVITGKGLSRLGNNVAALVGLCESKYSLMGVVEYRVDEEVEEEDGRASRGDADSGHEPEPEKPQKKEGQHGYVPRLKVKRAIEYGDEQLLRQLLQRVSEPVNNLKYRLRYTVDIVNLCIGYAYELELGDLKMLELAGGKTFTPSGLLLQDIDMYIDALAEAIDEFAHSSTQALEGAEVYDRGGAGDVDVLPRDEVFLISSFLLNLRLGATQILLMMRHARGLVEMRQERKTMKMFHWPDVSLKRWLHSGSEETEAMNLSGGVPQFGGAPHDDEEDDEDEEQAAQESADQMQWNTHGHVRDSESLHPTLSTVPNQNERHERAKKRRMERAKRIAKQQKLFGRSFRENIANFIDWVRNSDNLIYATKFAFGMLLLSWPAFVAGWGLWYHHARAVWVAFIFILVFENAVGSTVWIFFLRAVGTVLGSTWGYASYQAGKGNPVVMGIMLIIASIPAFYVQRMTRFLKAAMVCTVSMCVVAISTHLQTVPGSSFENFYKRTSASLIGGSVALLVQLVLFPVKARNKLKEQTASAIAEINHMVQCVALGVDESPTEMLHHPRFLLRFEKAGKAASDALTAAEAFLEYTKFESRLKGPFDGHRVVYAEILFVLRQIVDRLENLLRLRIAYGSAIVDEFNARVRPYRRNVTAALTLTLYGISQSLTQKLPLPQFLPSARLAHLRLVVRVRQILHDEAISTAAAATISNMHILCRKRDQFQGNNTPVSNIIPNNTPSTGSENEEKRLGVESKKAATDGAETATSTTEEAVKKATAVRQNALRLKILSWNASSAAMEECVEYVEELVELVKMLVGVTEFRSGLLHRPTFKEYLRDMNKAQWEVENATGTSMPGDHNRSSRMRSTLMGGGGQSDRGSAMGVGDGAVHGVASGQAIGAAVDGGGEVERARYEENNESVGDLMNGGGDSTLPPPLVRIQTRREAERVKRKKE